MVVGFFFSHILKEQRHSFLAGITHAFDPGTRIVLFNNKYVEGSSTPITRRTAEGDTYQTRKLSDGSTHQVLKNFPAADELGSALSGGCRAVEVSESTYFWRATGVLSG